MLDYVYLLYCLIFRALDIPGAALIACEQVMRGGIVGVCDVANGIYLNIPGFAGQ